MGALLFYKNKVLTKPNKSECERRIVVMKVKESMFTLKNLTAIKAMMRYDENIAEKWMVEKVGFSYRQDYTKLYLLKDMPYEYYETLDELVLVSEDGEKVNDEVYEAFEKVESFLMPLILRDYMAGWRPNGVKYRTKKHIHDFIVKIMDAKNSFVDSYQKTKKAPKCKLTKNNKVMVVEGIKVHKNADINAFGLYYAATTYWPLIGHRIVIDEYFYTLPEIEQAAVLYHEIGHIKNRHLSKGWFKKMWLSLTKGKLSIRRFVDELEADEYAYEHEPEGTKAFLRRMSTFNKEAQQRYETLTREKITPFEAMFGIDFKNIKTINLDEIE